ncbi:MAG: anthranilate synthase component I [Thermodesulfobacteriota bacterium]
MFVPDFAEFKRLSSQGNVIPVYREILADLETPVSVYLKLSDHPSFLLESVVGGEKWGRYSFIGSGTSRTISGTGGDLFGTLGQTLKEFRPVQVPGLPRFTGGLVGYFGYDIVRQIEPRVPDLGHPGLGLPDYHFILSDRLVIFDNFAQKIKVVCNAFVNGSQSPEEVYQKACTEVDGLIARLKRPSAAPEVLSGAGEGESDHGNFVSNFPKKKEFEEIVSRAKEYIRAGDIFQVVLSQRFSRDIACHPFDVYRALRVINPSPYMYYLNFGDFILAGSSPEILVRLEERKVVVRPIAGTRPRGRTEDEDHALEQEMREDPKECAEHIMLVDLGRNDVGRVAETGSVEVTELMAVERYSHVMHMVSNVEGTLRPGADATDVIRACFPAGTLSGAPKVRAMEIIEELEPDRRGSYGGAVGYFGFSGNMDMAITIRTILMQKGQAFIQAGAGIVADSDPEREYYETVNKARGMMKAVEMAEKGLE